MFHLKKCNKILENRLVFPNKWQKIYLCVQILSIYQKKTQRHNNGYKQFLLVAINEVQMKQVKYELMENSLPKSQVLE